jgi:hypothetical protein
VITIGRRLSCSPRFMFQTSSRYRSRHQFQLLHVKISILKDTESALVLDIVRIEVISLNFIKKSSTHNDSIIAPRGRACFYSVQFETQLVSLGWNTIISVFVFREGIRFENLSEAKCSIAPRGNSDLILAAQHESSTTRMLLWRLPRQPFCENFTPQP